MSFSVPEGWGQLTQEQLRYVIRLFSLYDSQDDAISHIRTAALFHFMDVVVDGEQSDGILCHQKSTGKTFLVDIELLPWMLRQINWIAHPELMSQRLEVMHGYHAVDFMLRGLTFGEYLTVENYFQGWIGGHNFENINKMINILYRVPEGEKMRAYTRFDHVATILWWGAVKYSYGKMFPHFLKPSDENYTDRTSQREVMDSQIRLLTKGDVTKENEILNNTPTLRALTELDAQAMEAEEIEKLKKK
ncbi:MAG: hypothetical protein LKE54_03710 [Prevotella sp.]|jgi:hypothetical protein|nr:hypothetical protein [Prevotella sp.]MCH3994153.1 hypothetical protein [Prevotella sp.]